MLKFSFLKKNPTPSDQLQVGDVLHSRLDERRMTITIYLTMHGISHYCVLIKHGNKRIFKLLSSYENEHFRYLLTTALYQPDRDGCRLSYHAGNTDTQADCVQNNHTSVYR
jgi:hypothetical protein